MHKCFDITFEQNQKYIKFTRQWYSIPARVYNIYENNYCYKALDKEYLVIIRDNFLSVLHKNLCCDPSSEPSQRDGSHEGSQHMDSKRNKKNYPSIIIKYSSYLSRALLLYTCISTGVCQMCNILFCINICQYITLKTLFQNYRLYQRLSFI